MPAPQAPQAGPLDGTEWQLLIQGGKLTRAQIKAIITFARTGYTTDNLPEGLQNLYFTNSRAVAALADALSRKLDKTDFTASVISVNTKTGAVTITKADLGIGSVDNTSDANKPVSTAQAAAIAAAKPRIARFSGTTNASGVAAITFSPTFTATPDIDVIEGWSGDQMITGAIVAGSASPTGCQVQVMVSRGTLVLTTGPFQKAAAGVSVTVRAIGN